MATGSLSAYGLGILRHGPGRVPQTMAFWSLATAQLLHVLLARAGTRPASRYEHALHRPLVLGIGSSALLQAASFLLPSLRTLLGGVPLALAEILTALLIGIAPVAAIEIQRLLSAPRDQTGVEVAPASAEPPYRPNDAD